MPAKVDRLETASRELIRALEQFVLNAQNARDFQTLSSNLSYLYSNLIRAKNAL